jgi:hypothetical protein
MHRTGGWGDRIHLGSVQDVSSQSNKPHLDLLALQADNSERIVIWAIAGNASRGACTRATNTPLATLTRVGTESVSCCNRTFAPQPLLSCPQRLRPRRPWRNLTRAGRGVRRHLMQLRLRTSPRRHLAQLRLRTSPRPRRAPLRRCPRRALLLKYRRRASCPLRILHHSSSPVLPAVRLPAQPRGTLRHREHLRLRGRRSNKSAAATSAAKEVDMWVDK